MKENLFRLFHHIGKKKDPSSWLRVFEEEGLKVGEEFFLVFISLFLFIFFFIFFLSSCLTSLKAVGAESPLLRR